MALQNVYKINLSLPNNVLLNDVIVTEVPMISQADMLIGMSVINRGDFSVSNYNGKTILSFRIPSLADADYVELLRSQIPKTSTKIGRNEPCPCGSGKKYKQCCGKWSNIKIHPKYIYGIIKFDIYKNHAIIYNYILHIYLHKVCLKMVIKCYKML